MGQQLELFTRLVAAPAAPAPAPPPEEPLPPAPNILPGQTGLFDFRTAALGRARASLAAGELAAACRELAALLPRCPNDATVAREAAEAHVLRERLARIDAPRTRHRAKALLAFARDLDGAPEPRASLRRRLLVRVADELRKELGDAGELEGKLPGEYLLDAGELDAAQASLLLAAASPGGVQALVRFADVVFLRGDPARARRLYLEALLQDPFHPSQRTVRDEAVRGLLDRVRYELEIEEEPEAWTAPAGVLMGVLPRWQEEGEGLVLGDVEELPPARRDALGQARDFVALLAAAAEARGDEVIAVRRRMKQLSPPLFAAYMERVVRRHAG